MTNCECIVHRYHIFHITPDGDLYSHSQASCDLLSRYERLHGYRAADVPVSEYRHDLTKSELIALYERYARKENREKENAKP